MKKKKKQRKNKNKKLGNMQATDHPSVSLSMDLPKRYMNAVNLLGHDEFSKVNLLIGIAIPSETSDEASKFSAHVVRSMQVGITYRSQPISVVRAK